MTRHLCDLNPPHSLINQKRVPCTWDKQSFFVKLDRFFLLDTGGGLNVDVSPNGSGMSLKGGDLV